MPAAAFLYTLFGMNSDSFEVPRRSERKAVRKAIVLLIESDDSPVPSKGTTVDVSKHGARIVAERPLTPGQTLSLIQPEDPTHAVPCTVVWAGDVGSDGHDQAGLKFLGSPSARFEN